MQQIILNIFYLTVQVVILITMVSYAFQAYRLEEFGGHLAQI